MPRDPAPFNSGQMSIDQRSMASVHGTEGQTPARSQIPGSGRIYMSQSVRRGVVSVQSPSRMQIEQSDENQSVANNNQTVYFGTNIDEEQINRNFQKFILEFQINQKFIYVDKLNNIMETEESYVLVIEGQHLFQFNKQLYQQLIFYPGEIIPIFDRVAQKIFFEFFLLPKSQNEQQREMNEQRSYRLIVGIINLSKSVRVRELNPRDINHLVQVKGIVIRCSELYPEMKSALFRCSNSNCLATSTIALERGRIEEPTICQKCRAKGTFEIIHNLCQFTDKQYVKLQEQPETVPEGDTPQTVSIMAYDDNVDNVKPGDRITVIGVYRAQGIRQVRTQRVLKSIYTTYLDVISYDTQKTGQEITSQTFNEELTAKLQKLSQEPKIVEKLCRSLAPSIFELDDVKLGILCQVFGGSNKQFSQSGRGRFRAEINILLVGDPSTSKSQLLKYVHSLTQRGIYTSGKGSSAVGLTVYITRDPETKEIVLESGALVLSDMGICCIDEFDKMDDNAKTILHEAMEQQTVSVAKAGIVSQLNARTSVLAAANPLFSRYNIKKSVVENINLPPTLLSRFDLIYLMLDEMQSDRDKYLAMHILQMYSANVRFLENDIIDHETLMQYISFAKDNVIPKINEESEAELIQAYVEMRKQGTSSKTITATPRQLESLIRISEALAKMEFSEVVEIKHVKEAVRLMHVATKRAAMDPVTGLIDMDMLTTGRTQATRTMIQRFVTILKDILKANIKEFKGQGMKFADLLKRANEQLGEQQQEGEVEEGQRRREDVNANEFKEALKILEDESYIILTGDRLKPRVKAGYNAQS